MSALTLPGDIPGLLRRGSPVVLATRTYGGSVFLDGACGVVCSDGGRVATETLGGSPVLVSTGAGDLALDLTDATGRAHAAWWLEAQSPRWRTLMAGRRGGELLRILECVEMHKRLDVDEREARGRARLTLAGLDPNDPRLLPDGSRWVDAEALRLVCLHVAGRAP